MCKYGGFMKTGKILKTLRSKRGKLVSLEPFSFKKEREFYQLYQTSKLDWEKFLVLHFKNIDDAHAFIAQEYDNDMFTGYFITNNETKKMVGFVFGDQDARNSIMRTTAIGCEYQKSGYGSEAMRLFESIMAKAGYEYVKVACDADNQRAKEIVVKNNFVYSETEHFCLGPVSMDLMIYSKLLEKSK